MKKILHIVEAYGGGVLNVLNDLLNTLSQDEEFELYLAYSIRQQTPKDFKQLLSPRIKLIEIKNFTREINPLKDIKAFIEIKALINKIKPDIIHLHSSKAGFIGRFATLRFNGDRYYNPHGFCFLMKDVSKLKRRIYWLLEKIASFTNCTIVACSNGEYEEAKKLTSKVICINNGVNIDKLKKYEIEEKLIDFNHLQICTVGRIDYQKNPQLFNQIAEEFPQYNFTWIGDGDLREELKSTNIIISGWKSHKDVLKLVQSSDIFILTSLWEGMPISLLEAMYFKKICIVSNCIGNKDVIENNNNGYIFNDLKELSQLFKKMSMEKIQSVKMNAYNSIITEYNTLNMTEKYKSMYIEG